MKNNYNSFIYLSGLEKFKDCEDKIYQFILSSGIDDRIKSIGLDYYFIKKQSSLREIGKCYLLTPERIRQILGRFVRLIMHPSKKEALLASLDEILKGLLNKRNNLEEQLKSVNMELSNYSNLLRKGDYGKKISELEFSVRTANVLREASIYTIGALTDYTEFDLLCLRNCGKKSLQEIKDILRSEGLELNNTKSKG